MITDFEKLAIEQAEEAFTVRQTDYIDLYERVWDFILPERQDRKRTGTSDNDIGDKVYDSTGAHATEALANYLTSTMFPSWEQWAFLIPGPHVAGKEKSKLRKQLDMVNKVMHYHFQRSNLAQEAQPAILDCIVGTGDLIVEPHKSGKGLQFKCAPLKSIMVDEDEDGALNYVYQMFDLKARDIIKLYSDKIPPVVMKELTDALTRKHTCWSIVTPEDGTAKFRHIVTMKSYKYEFVLKSNVIKYNPHTPFRWSKVPDSAMGRGPAIRAYYDIRYLNNLKEHGLRGLALAVAGVWLGKDDGIFNPYSVKLEPGIVLPVMDNADGNPAMRRLEVGTDFNLAQFGIESLRQDINKALYADRFGPLDMTPRPATETVMRDKLIAQQMGGAYGRFRSELLVPLVSKSIAILQDQGELPEGIRIDGRMLDVHFVSKLEQAQRMQEVDNLMQLATIAQSVSQFDPKAGQVLDYTKVVRLAAEKLQSDPDMLRSDEEIEEIMSSAQETAMAMGQAAMEGQNGPQGQIQQ